MPYPPIGIDGTVPIVGYLPPGTPGANNPNATTGYDKSQPDFKSAYEVIAAIRSGQISALEGYQIIASQFSQELMLDPQIEKLLNELIARENTGDARNWDEYVAMNSLLWNAAQLQALGMSSSNVTYTGGASMPSLAASATDMSNVSQKNFDARLGLAKSLIYVAGSMARAGIYGNALKAVKGAAANTSNAMAHAAQAYNSTLRYGVPSKKNVIAKGVWDKLVDSLG